MPAHIHYLCGAPGSVYSPAPSFLEYPDIIAPPLSPPVCAHRPSYLPAAPSDSAAASQVCYCLSTTSHHAKSDDILTACRHGRLLCCIFACMELLNLLPALLFWFLFTTVRTLPIILFAAVLSRITATLLATLGRTGRGFGCGTTPACPSGLRLTWTAHICPLHLPLFPSVPYLVSLPSTLQAVLGRYRTTLRYALFAISFMRMHSSVLRSRVYMWAERVVCARHCCFPHLKLLLDISINLAITLYLSPVQDQLLLRRRTERRDAELRTTVYQ